MRKFLVSAALVTATLAAAVPASAQWSRPVPQGNAYGYENYGQARRLEVRVMQLRRQIAQLDRRNILSNREARRLDAEARNLTIRVRQLAYNGIDRRERYAVERQIANLEQRIRYEARDGNRRPGNDGYGRDRDRDGRIDRYDNNIDRDRDGRDDRYDNNIDRDRDGRDDRYEDDRGRYPG